MRRSTRASRHGDSPTTRGKPRSTRVRALAAGCFDGDADAVALVPSAAYGIAIAARNLPLARGDGVLVTASAFPSQVLAWHARCRDDGARLVVARPAPGESETDAMLRMLDADAAIRVLSLAHVSWVDGSVLDLDTIAERARARGTALVLDLSQSLGAMPARIAAWQPAFAVSVGYKWLLGPGGLAYLWVAPAWRDHGDAIEQHWRARDPAAVWREDPGADRRIAPVRAATTRAKCRRRCAWRWPRRHCGRSTPGASIASRVALQSRVDAARACCAMRVSTRGYPRPSPRTSLACVRRARVGRPSTRCCERPV